MPDGGPHSKPVAACGFVGYFIPTMAMVPGGRDCVSL